MAFAVTEPDDDAARLRHAEVKLFGVTVTRLLAISDQMPARDALFLRAMDTRLNVLGQLPLDVERMRLKGLAWTHRRAMPAHLAPKLPPHDPCVREMDCG